MGHPLSTDERKELLARTDLRDEHRFLVAIVDFNARGRSPSTEEIATFLGWTLERTEVSAAAVKKAGLAATTRKQDPEGATWRPSIFMPRWASRITLEVTEVRAERLQAISEDDAKAEGVTMVPFYPDDGLPLSQGFMFGKDDGASPLHNSAAKAFARLWDAINADRASWASNPWVWVISFRRLPG